MEPALRWSQPRTGPSACAKEGTLHIRRRYLSTADVGRELGVSVTDVEILIASGTLPAFKILGEWRIDRELLEQMIDSLYEDAADPPGAAAGSEIGRASCRERV